ncbi:hypothetical protein FNV43_RR03295 [Rhamnella rubrinervis]|uniref:VAN3-binding protein n=1 Tax=Rhamnella rubrinervis TaxID=2594499 RepID=A0A8K0HHR1_9ROSA|nr:hypothetical protein FNV43_RR03295 [Rhamnella rubrinervis]
MDYSSFNPTPSEAHPETMDFLSRAWCNFAVQALQPDLQDQSVAAVLDNQIAKLEINTKTAPYMKLDKSVKMEGPDVKSLPQWKSNDVKSWIWMQQAMHPELNYNGYFRKKWMSWKVVPFKNLSIRKWLKEIKMRRKEEDRLQKAEVHAAISVAGVAAALAAIAAENAKQEESSTAKGAAVASAAALVAAQCAKVAEAMGAKREHLNTVMGSAMTGTTASDVLTLTAAAKTSLKGAATLKQRTGCKNRLKGIAPVLPIEESCEIDLDLEKCRSTLAKGAELGIETPDGDYVVRSVSIVLNSEAKLLLKIRKLNLLKSKKESVILELHAELYKDSEGGDEEEINDTCYMIVLTTSRGIYKLDMGDDYQRYRAWATTINHLLMLSSSITKYQLQFCKI